MTRSPFSFLRSLFRHQHHYNHNHYHYQQQHQQQREMHLYTKFQNPLPHRNCEHLARCFLIFVILLITVTHIHLHSPLTQNQKTQHYVSFSVKDHPLFRPEKPQLHRWVLPPPSSTTSNTQESIKKEPSTQTRTTRSTQQQSSSSSSSSSSLAAIPPQSTVYSFKPNQHFTKISPTSITCPTRPSTNSQPTQQTLHQTPHLLDNCGYYALINSPRLRQYYQKQQQKLKTPENYNPQEIQDDFLRGLIQGDLSTTTKSLQRVYGTISLESGGSNGDVEKELRKAEVVGRTALLYRSLGICQDVLEGHERWLKGLLGRLGSSGGGDENIKEGKL